MQSTRIIRKCHITEMLPKYPLFWLELKVSLRFYLSSERVFMERLLLLPIFGSNTVASIDGFVSLAELTLCKFLRLFLKPFFSFPSILIKTRCD